MTSPRIALVVAVAENGVIGRNGDLPWRIPSDLKTFRRLTMGKPVVMGRKTFQSLKKPLDGRDNIVVTREPGFRVPDGVLVRHTLGTGLEAARAAAKARQVDEVMIIGGADIFRLTLPFADRLYWTHVEGHPEGDTFFPAFDAHEWAIVHRETLPRGDKDEFACTLKIMDKARRGAPAAPARS